MPWSQWIQSEDYHRSGQHFEASQTVSSMVDGAPGSVAGPSGQDALDAALASMETAKGALTEDNVSWAGNLSSVARRAIISSIVETGFPIAAWQASTLLQEVIVWYDKARTGYPDWREWFPSELDGLEYGVEYGPRPDRTEGEDEDVYIEYEPGGVAEFLGWTGTAKVYLEEAPTSLDADPVSFAVTVLPDHPYNGPPTEPPVPSWVSSGTPVLSVSPDATGIYPRFESADYTLDADLDSFATALIATAGGTVYGPNVGDSNMNVSAVVQLLGDDVRGTIRLPRWRYWIPGRLPLRQRQRDDGLALRGTPSWKRGTSRQASNRARGYL